MFIQRYNIATRIGFVVGILLVMMLVLALVEVKGLNSIRASMDEIVGKHYQRMQTAEELRFLARHSAVLVRNILMVTDAAEKEQEKKRFEEGSERFFQLVDELAGQEQTENERKIVEQVVDGGRLTFSLWRTITDPESGSTAEHAMAVLRAEVRNHQWGLLDDLDALVRLQRGLAEETMALAVENYERTKTVMAMVNILAIGAGLFSVAAVAASIVSPLHEITRKVDVIAGGDLTTRVELDQEDEIGRLAQHINRMAEKLEADETELEKYRYHLEELIEWRTGEMNEQRERFISVLIHDLKGPLVPILGFARLLVNKERLDHSRLEKYHRELNDSAVKLATAIEQTTQALKEKRTAFSFDREPFDMEELLHSVARDCERGLTGSTLRIELNSGRVNQFRSSGEIRYSGDISKMRSVFENLIGNAIKYANTLIQIELKTEGEYIVLTVDDDGRGVAEQFRKKIFEEYYQAPDSKDGTGVGLYSVRRIVEHYRGGIFVKTSPLDGARFVVMLPQGH